MTELHRLSRDNVVYCLDPEAHPVLRIGSSARVTFETHDARGGKLKVPADVVATTPDFSQRFPKVNPVTGPVAIEGAEPGDVVKVTILDIDLDPYGFILVKPDMGISHGKVTEPVAKICSVADGVVSFDDFRFSVAPMVGVIAVAPAAGAIAPALVGRHGGNMDCKRIAVGTRLYLPVQVAEALVYLGDVHAAMGDGEVTGTGIEIGARVTVDIELLKQPSRAWPWAETESHLISICSAPTYEAAGRLAVDEMIGLLQERIGVSATDAYMLISAIGDVCINQSCGSSADISVRVEMPKLGKGLSRIEKEI